MLDFGTTYDVIRIYFNRKEDAPNFWSIDNGTQDTEINVPNVIVQGVARFECTGEEKKPDTPVAWMELRNARLHRIDDSEEVFVENSSE